MVFIYKSQRLKNVGFVTQVTHWGCMHVTFWSPALDKNECENSLLFMFVDLIQYCDELEMSLKLCQIIN